MATEMRIEIAAAAEEHRLDDGLTTSAAHVPGQVDRRVPLLLDYGHMSSGE